MITRKKHDSLNINHVVCIWIIYNIQYQLCLQYSISYVYSIISVMFTALYRLYLQYCISYVYSIVSVVYTVLY